MAADCDACGSPTRDGFWVDAGPVKRYVRQQGKPEPKCHNAGLLAAVCPECYRKIFEEAKEPAGRASQCPT